MKKKLLGLAIVAVVAFALVLVSVVHADDSNSNSAEGDGHAQPVMRTLMRPILATVSSPASTTVKFKGQEVELEKIDSPEQLKDFRVMKRVGNTLYGMTIQTFQSLLSQMTGQSPVTSGNASSSAVLPSTASSTLEKIPAPQFIRFFQNIRRVGNALWGVRKSENEGENRASSTPVFVKVQPSEVACVSAAIKAKDDAASSRVASTASSLAAAINARSTCQITALSSSDQQSALNECVKTFQNTRQEISKTSQQAQKDAWQTFRTSLKACRVVAVQACANASSTSCVASTTSTIQNEQESGDQGEIMIPDGGNDTMNTVINNGAGE